MLEGMVDMRPGRADFLRLTPLVAALIGAYLCFIHHHYIGMVLYIISGIAGSYALGSGRDYWNFAQRTKVNIFPVGMFVIALLVARYDESVLWDFDSNIPLFFYPLGLLVLGVTLYTGIRKPQSPLFLVSFVILSILTAAFTVLLMVENITSILQGRLISVSIGVVILLLGFLRRRTAQLPDHVWERNYFAEQERRTSYSTNFSSGQTYEENHFWEDPSFFGDDNQSDSEQEESYSYVRQLEQERQRKGYKPGWLYYRCRDTGLLDIYNDLIDSGEIKRESQRSQNESQSKNYNEQKRESSSPYDILGIRPGASREEIKAAYREQIKLYHPDKVASLGEELRNVANRMSASITGAYRTLIPNG